MSDIHLWNPTKVDCDGYHIEWTLVLGTSAAFPCALELYGSQVLAACEL